MDPCEQNARRGRFSRQRAVMAAALALSFLVGISAAEAQSINVLHSFTNGADGECPYGGVTLDRAGNLYGTTNLGGGVYKLSRSGSGWTLNTLYTFNHPQDPTDISAGVVFGPDGTLYGTGSQGGANGDGAVFNLRPPASVCRSVSCPWTLSLLHSFSGSDGSDPYFGNLVFDSAGNIYGTTYGGGAHGYGVVFELTRSGDSWMETVLYSFAERDDGGNPESGVVFDSAGNLYGSTFYGGTHGDGVVYELSPSGSGWSETTLYNFTGGSDGENPVSGVAVDSHGNLYGTTSAGGSGGTGTDWVLSPSGGNWTLTVVQSFSGYEGPFASPTLDASGNVYGTSAFAGGYGVVYKNTPSGSGWTYTDFDFNESDGAFPVGGVSIDASGNLYGTTCGGGTHDDGVVWEITP